MNFTLFFDYRAGIGVDFFKIETLNEETSSSAATYIDSVVAHSFIPKHSEWSVSTETDIGPGNVFGDAPGNPDDGRIIGNYAAYAEFVSDISTEAVLAIAFDEGTENIEMDVYDKDRLVTTIDENKSLNWYVHRGINYLTLYIQFYNGLFTRPVGRRIVFLAQTWNASFSGHCKPVLVVSHCAL